jgi:BirA family biotin operon repressor/biotin-[acetyl-CoA-carboxylase] ligase
MTLRVFRHGLVDSTSERAFAALADGTARHGDVHVAEGQTAGRGRFGRTWVSAPGEGLYASLVLLPGPPTPHPAALTMGAGLAVLESVRALGVRDARLKWPNDVVVAGAKLAGILVESRGLDPERPHAVVGIGINVRQREFPAELVAERAVTSLHLQGIETSVERALEALLERLAPRMDEACGSGDAVAADYARAIGVVGRDVRVAHGRSETYGRVRALTLRGLELETEEGDHVRCALEHVQALETTD